MSHSTSRFARTLAAVCAWAVLSVVAASPTLAQGEPDQLLFAPLPLDPGDLDGAGPVSAGLRVYRLPDGRRAENYTVGGWVRVGQRHAFAWEMAYAGVEAEDFFRYGGGAPRWQWTTHLRQATRFGVAVDLAATLPIGDGSLHPLAAKAPSAHIRLRVSPLGGEVWRVWVAYWGQRVSPPEDRDRPLAYFPSGSGMDVAFVASTSRMGFEAWLHQQLGGLPGTTWIEASAELSVVEGLALRLGAMVNPGPDDRRQADLGWTVGVSWRPRPVEE